MTLDLFRQQFLRQFFHMDGSLPLIGIADMSGFDRRRLAEQKVAGNWGPLPGFVPTDALVWRNDRSERELWVRPFDKTKVRSTLYTDAWAAFTGGSAPAGTVIDHLYPETAAARFGMSHVRLLPVDAAANSRTTHLEKILANAKYRTRDHWADYFAAVKAMGYRGRITRDRSCEEIATEIIRHAIAIGAPVPPQWVHPAFVAEEIKNTAWKLQRIRDEWARQRAGG